MDTPGHAMRALDIAAEALEHETTGRSEFLNAACAADPALRAEVDSLLRFEQPARGFIERPAVAAHAESFLEGEAAMSGGTLQPGQSLGNFRVRSLLGEGGMGEVYLAEDTELDRLVAIKLVKRGMASETLLRHFGREKRILAGLNDPHIARLYGGAVTPEGMPYLVMEYVEGERLDAYCDRRRLPVSARLALFRKVCAAVAYAHQNLVIHRDLKPANIRVTAEGEPKLLDFGIAKLLDPLTPDDAEATVTQFGPMTPGYASPEQLRGDRVNTATDIYSLGVVLYELLCGRRPFETPRRPTDHLARAARPSAVPTAEAAEARGTTTGRLSRQLSGDLDNIALMAIRHDPARRYASVSQLAEDIRRHLDGQPVAARKETLRYIGTKFIGRNKAAATAAALVLLTLVGGIVATAWQAHRAEEQRRRAERRFEDVRRLADSLMFEIHDSVQSLAGSTPTRRLIVARALQYLDILNQEADSPALRRDLATAYEKIGDIQGNPYSANLGDTDGALASYRKAESLRKSFTVSGLPAPVEVRMELGRTYRALGDILELKGDFDGMTREYRLSLELFEKLARERPTELPVREELGRAYEASGDGFTRMKDGRTEELRCYEKSYDCRRELAASAPDNPKYRRSMAIMAMKLGMSYMPDKMRALSSLRRSVELHRALAQGNPDNVRARREYALALFNLGTVLADTGDAAKSLVPRQEALAIRRIVAAADPKDTQAQFDLASSESQFANALTGVGQPGEALAPAQEAVERFRNLMASDSGNAVYARNCGLAYEEVGDAQAVLARWTEAQGSYERARELFEELRGKGTLRPTDAGKPEALAAKIARCQEGMAILRK